MSATAALLEADAERRAAMISGDVPALTALLGDELVWNHSSGRADDKTSFLAGIAAGSVTYLELETTDVTVSRYGDVFICHGILNGRASREGVEKTLRNRFLGVWQQRDGAFQLLAMQSTGF